MPDISDERIQQMKDALAYCGWTFKWEDETGIVFDVGHTENPNRPPVGTRYDYGLYENGTDRIQFQSWEQVQDMIDKAIYYSVEEVAGTAKGNYTKEHNGVTLDGQELEEAMYPERFDGGWEQPEYSYVYIPNADGKWADVTEIDLSEAHFSGNTMTYEGVRYNLDKTFFYATEELAMDSLSEDGTKKDVHMVSARLKIDGETEMPYYASMGKDHDFPPQCFAVDNETHKLVMVQAGEKGTFSTPIQSTNAVDNQVLANKLNARYGVTNEQVSEMLYCAKNGWDKETREAWAEQKDNITPEQAEINVKVEEIENIAISGHFEDYCDIDWKLTKDGILTFEGTGQIPVSYNGYPWSEYSDMIKKVEISDGITIIPDQAFENCHNLKNVELGHSIQEIGFNAFQNTGLEGKLSLPENAHICSFAFQGCDKLTEIVGCGNRIEQGAISDTGATTVDLANCYLVEDSVYANPNLKVIITQGCTFEDDAIHSNESLEHAFSTDDTNREGGMKNLHGHFQVEEKVDEGVERNARGEERKSGVLSRFLKIVSKRDKNSNEQTHELDDKKKAQPSL